MPRVEDALPEIYSHLDQPWFGLKRYAGETFKAAVRPLNEEGIQQRLWELANHDPERQLFQEWLQIKNKEVLGETDKIAVVLDGRIKQTPEGFLGDMIEATRMVRAVRAIDKAVTVITPHVDLFQGHSDEGVNIIPVPETMPAPPTHPWRGEHLRFLYENVGDMPILFPLNAALPLFVKLKEGKDPIQNIDTISMMQGAFRPRNRILHAHVTWGASGLHQLQALQTSAYLLGIEGAENWQEFPDAFLHPTKQAQDTAKEVVRIYGCFGSNSKYPPLYLHPGVATSASKILTKFYPEEKWVEALNQLAQADARPGSVTMLEPSDPEQSAMTLRLATAAVEAGLRVAKVPMASVKKHYDWNLGSFIAFLTELSKHKGVILGCDSMPAGHAGPATGNPAIVLGNHSFNPGFYSPAEKALVVLPPKGSTYTSTIEPERVVQAIQSVCKDPNLQAVVAKA